MSLPASGQTWEEASSPAVARLVRRFEAACHGSAGPRPDPTSFLPSDTAQRPAALLALLRADLALAWEASQSVRVESYRDRYPELDQESLVALIYEEFCIREDAGESPDPGEFEARFPTLAVPLRQVFEIHGLVGSDRTSSWERGEPPEVPFPEAGQTIAGFRLVEELGRGSFARVFRAEERQLADRPVALKVARTGSREPQTLARLQHTHIVPVHSYRTDPATGLHLLCMPYFGRLTLARVLDDPAARSARTGAELVAAIDRLQPADGASSGRSGLARRSYVQAIAWWGARLAEGLQHAHDRGVLHRDVKPSNVLVTADGMPMLLDFNLAHSYRIDEPNAPALGGTLAYMPPEHLEALADGIADEVDIRSDLYSLGVVLFEALARGRRPFSTPSGAISAIEVLIRAAEERRAGSPSLREAHPDVPPALDAVVRKCLAPEPSGRYESAADLAVDLQAVADDGPLRFAREPEPSRTFRWLRRHRRRLALAAPPILALMAVAAAATHAELARVRQEGEVKHWISEGDHSAKEDRLDLAADQFATAARLASGDSRLEALRNQARERERHARQSKAVSDKADELFKLSESLRFHLLGFSGDAETAARKVESALRLFSVPDDVNWSKGPDLRLLDPARRARLLDEVNGLLFLWVVALALDRDHPDDPALARRAVAICDGALAFAEPAAPWRALRDRYAAGLSGRPSAPTSDVTTRETSAHACFQWALLRHLEGRRDAAIAWLERATQLKPDDYWSEFYLAYRHDRAGHAQKALEHYTAAVALRPKSPWAYYNRARLERSRGAWDLAINDLRRALETARDFDFPEARLELGVVHQILGDYAGARTDYDRVIADGPEAQLARFARFNRAKLDLDAGAVDRARAEFDALLAEVPDDATVRLGRALLELRAGRLDRAEADLTALLRVRQDADRTAGLLSNRALARLALGRPADALADAEAAFRLRPDPGRERLWIRTLLATGRDREILHLDRPDTIARLPAGGPPLAADLRAAVRRLGQSRDEAGALAILTHRARAVILSALGDKAAEREASRAVALSSLSAESLLVRARVRQRAGDRRGALDDVDQALILEPDSPRLLELRGTLWTELARPGAGLADLDRAVLEGSGGTVWAARARALTALGRDEQAVENWSRSLAFDPGDPGAYLGRARALIRLRHWDQALADLEQAADWSGDHADLATQVFLAYAACLPERPDRLPRVLTLARRALTATVGRANRGTETPSIPTEWSLADPG